MPPKIKKDANSQPLLTPEKVGQSTKTFLELFKAYWGYFMTFVAAVTFIWTLGVKSEKRNMEKTDIVKDVKTLSEEVTSLKVLESAQSENLDSILDIINEIKSSQQDVINSQNALRNSYVKYLSNDRALSKSDFIQYMEGIQFQLAPVTQQSPTSDTTKQSYKITVKPKK